MSLTPIEWTEQTWNPIAGCSLASPGCSHCYAMPLAARIARMNEAARDKAQKPPAPHYDGLIQIVNGHAVWTGKVAQASRKTRTMPLHRRQPTLFFVNSMSDLFHEDVPDEWIDEVFAVMALTPHHTYQVLTKRVARARAYLTRSVDWSAVLGAALTALMTDGRIAPDQATELHHRLTIGQQPWPLPNVWLGVSTERQKEADERIPDLLATPAAVRFVSAEPLLGPIDLEQIKISGIVDPLDAFDGRTWCRPPSLGGMKFYSGLSAGRGKLDWVIVGGESGPAARPMHPDWARSLRDQCAAAGVPYFFKQWGQFLPAGQHLPGAGKIVGATAAAKPGRMKLHYRNGRDTIHYAFADQGVPSTSIDNLLTFQLGKRRAGRLLDGAELNGMPEAWGDRIIATPGSRKQAEVTE